MVAVVRCAGICAVAMVAELTRQPRPPTPFRSAVLCTAVAGSLLFGSPLDRPVARAETTATTAAVWQLANGEVRLTDPLPFPNLAVASEVGSTTTTMLRRPRLLGSGGGGAVFAFSRDRSPSRGVDDDADEHVAVKISWVRSAASVERECAVLRSMEAKNVEGVERCLGMERYGPDDRRVVIALVPVVDNAVASVSDLNESVRPNAVRCIARTLTQMLAADVATIDVQPLMSKKTGDVVFIDMTEATLLHRPMSFLDEASASSFCSEMLSLVPDSLRGVAAEALVRELDALESRGVRISDEVCDLLRSQIAVLEEGTSL